MKTLRLRTPFDVGDIPLAENPRPQFARESYMTLNGKWDYAILNKDEKFDGNYQGKILVPFSPECLLAGVSEGTFVSPDDILYYHRKFNVGADLLKGCTVLHFDAVDMECIVSLNGQIVGTHKGGYMPFSLDVTQTIVPGENDIKVIVTDPSDSSYHTHAKQSLKRGGIWYTPQSGIWQSVWLESMPAAHIKDVTIVPDIDNNVVNLKFERTEPFPIAILVRDNGRTIASAICTEDEVSIPIQGYELWSPENPKLYDLIFMAKSGEDVDLVKSYFGMRKFSWVTDSKGIKRMGLNNKPYFNTGVLDQGYWSDGMLTPPSNEALAWDVSLMKSMGFNMIRKHIKIEPLRWYYECDRQGILVWQDMVTGGTKYNMMYIGVLPFLGIHIKDNKPSSYKKLARAEQESRDEFEREVRVTMNHLKNCVSLSTWVAFNEGWGQFDSVRIVNDMKQFDPTRMIDSVSGWNDQGKKSSDAKSLHIYFKPIKIRRNKYRAILLSEFGGYSLKTDKHMFSPDKTFGYKVFKTPEALAEAYEKLYEGSIIPAIEKGLSATVYTQLSDVEEEINGLVTYDRRVVKLPIELVKRLNAQLVIDKPVQPVVDTEAERTEEHSALDDSANDVLDVAAETNAGVDILDDATEIVEAAEAAEVDTAVETATEETANTSAQ